MQRKILALAVIALVSPLLLGFTPADRTAQGLTVYLLAQTPNCPAQVFGNPAALPYAVDMDQVAVDPVSGQKLLLNQGPLYGTVGKPWTISGYACDPDSDLLTLTATGGALVFNADGTYTVTGTASAAGVVYVTLTLTDRPPDATQALVRKGTWALGIVQPNNPPSLCGGRP